MRLKRRTALWMGSAMGVFAAVCFVASFFGDESYARTAATTAFFAGLFLGRASEFDLSAKNMGLRPDDPA